MNNFSMRAAFSLAVGAFLLPVLSAQGATLLFDDFNSVPNGTNINGRAPIVNAINGSTWTATTATLLGNGSGGLNGDSTINRSASLDLGAGYLSANPAVYQLSLNITQANVPGGASWIGFGFASGTDVAQNLVGNNGAPWMLHRVNGLVNFYGGPGVTAQLTNASGITVAASAAATVQHLFALTLDTTQPSWTLNGSIDGVPVDLNGTVLAGNTYAYTANPVASRYIQIATGVSGTGGVGSVDNIQLLTVVPEPGRAMLLLGGLGMTLLPRRRR